MMRYMVYDSNYDQVPLEKEIEYMRNYISLEKLRLNDQIPIEFEVTGDPENKQIAPLLLIPFLENSFKHGISNNNKDSWVKAILDCNHQKVTLHVSNSKTRHKGTAASANTGIGLDNVKRRLDLNYPGKYTLDVKELDDTYTATLDLQLN